MTVNGDSSSDPLVGTYRLVKGLLAKVAGFDYFYLGSWKLTRDAWSLDAPTSSWAPPLMKSTASSLDLIKSMWQMSVLLRPQVNAL